MDLGWLNELPDLEHYFFYGICKKHKKYVKFLTIPSRRFPPSANIIESFVEVTKPSQIKPIVDKYFSTFDEKKKQLLQKDKIKKYQQKLVKNCYELSVVVNDRNEHELLINVPNLNNYKTIKKTSFVVSDEKELEKKKNEFFKYFKRNFTHTIMTEYGDFSIGDIVHHCDGQKTHSGVILGIRSNGALLAMLTSNSFWGKREVTEDELAFFGFHKKVNTYFSLGHRYYQELYKSSRTFPIYRCEALYLELADEKK